MCTAISFNLKNHYFGRTLDLEYNYNEKVIITPRLYPFTFKYINSNNNHFAIIGIGIIINGFPLYYDACNEFGLCISGLNLPFSTQYNNMINNKINITSYEIIPYILSSCKTTKEAINLLKKINVTNDDFNTIYKASKLHFMISDKNNNYVIEIIDKKINLYENRFGVLTNEPPFPYHISNMNFNSNFNCSLTKSHFQKKLDIVNVPKGQNLIGIPGDNMSPSRFIKATYAKNNIIINNENITEIFNAFNNVFEINGLSIVENGKYYKTIYIVLYDTSNKIINFKTFCNSTIYSINLMNENLEFENLIEFDLFQNNKIHSLN